MEEGPSAKRMKIEETSSEDCTLDNALEATSDSWCNKTLTSLLNNDNTHDVTFKTSDGGSVSAHRAIVAAGSPVFLAMLYGNMKESSQKEIELPNIDSNMLKKLFSFFYTGHVQASLMDCLELLRAADYFDISELKAMCHDMIVNEVTYCFDFNDSICWTVTLFAAKHHLDTLVETCFNIMENNASITVHSSWFGSLPFSVLTMLVKSSNLEVKELDLFQAVVEWYKQQKETVSDDDVNSLFQQIRYPLMRKEDLIEKVHPTNMADPDLYKAALEYHDTDKFDGPEDQLKLRNYYFDFKPMEDDIRVEHTAKGTLLTNDGPATFVTCVAKVLFTDTIQIPFTFCLKSCRNRHNTLLKLYDINYCDVSQKDVTKLPIGKEVQGVVFIEPDHIKAHIGDVKLSILSCGELCEIGIRLYIGDQVHILRT